MITTIKLSSLKCTDKDIDRFWGKVSKVKTEKGCLEWYRPASDGYGTFKLDSVTIRPHRLAYELTYGEIPKDLFVCHTCDNPLCCNPEHLWLGNNQDNQLDMSKKGRYNHDANYKRGSKGTKNVKAKLTEKDVLEIRNLYKDKSNTIKEISTKFGVCGNTIRDVATGRFWSHIKEEICEIVDRRKKLSIDEVKTIRKLYNTENYSQEKLATKYNVSPGLIGHIVRNKIWKEI